MQGFTQLEVWRKAHLVVLAVYEGARAFPNDERFRLTNQLCRSAISVPANIAEGTGRSSVKDYVHFLYTARGSLEETKYHLLLARDLSYLADTAYDQLNAQADEVGKMLNGLISSLNRRGSAALIEP